MNELVSRTLHQGLWLNLAPAWHSATLPGLKRGHHHLWHMYEPRTRASKGPEQGREGPTPCTETRHQRGCTFSPQLSTRS